MKMKNLTPNFNYYEFLIMYENETSPTLPFIFIYLFALFFLSFASIVRPPRKLILIFSSTI